MYQIKLYYGYEEGECGIYHAFKATDPDVPVDSDAIGQDLAEQLDREVDDDCFNYNSMYIDLPASLIAKIKAEAVLEYLTHAIAQVKTGPEEPKDE